VRNALRTCSLGRVLDPLQFHISRRRWLEGGRQNALTVFPAAIGTLPSSADVLSLPILLAPMAAISDPLVRDDTRVADSFGLGPKGQVPKACIESKGLDSVSHRPSFGHPLTPFKSTDRTQLQPRVTRRPIRVGFLSSDFGVHPVAQLVRGIIRDLARPPRQVVDRNAPRWIRESKRACLDLMLRSEGPICQSLALSLKDQDSWWRRSIATEASVFSNLGMLPSSSSSSSSESQRIASTAEQASSAVALRPDVLIELNGHTMGSGLSLLPARIAPVQCTWLGHWQSTASIDVDYFIADAGTAPPDVVVAAHGRGATEGLVLLPLPSFSNDYASAQRHLAVADQRIELEPFMRQEDGERWDEIALLFEGVAKDARSALDKALAGTPKEFRQGVESSNLRIGGPERSELDGAWGFGIGDDDDPDLVHTRSSIAPWLIFGTFCSFSKWSPSLLDAWAAILRRFPRSVLWMPQHSGWQEAHAGARMELAARGVAPHRLIVLPKAPWISHLEHKTVTDIALDAAIKNGHTSTADALWAAVPTVTMRGDAP